MEPLQIIISIIIILTAIPLGFLLKHLTSDEKNIYKKYFPPILWIIAITASVFYTINIQIALTLTFIFIAIFVWLKAN